MSEVGENNYKDKILEILHDYPFGLSITKIAEKTNFHRNTVSKYMSILETEGSVNKKKIGTASIYATKKRKYLKRRLVVSFIQALLLNLKKNFPNKETKFKDIGREITEHFQFPIGNEYINEFKKVKFSSNNIGKLKLFQLFYNSFDFLQDDVDITIIELNGNRIVYRLHGSDFFNKSRDYIYFFYIICGITEGIYLQNLNLEIECNVENYKYSKQKEKSYIDISLKI
jgi:predicted transcriptional regulator